MRCAATRACSRLEYHLPKWDFYGYGGVEYVNNAAYKNSSGVYVGYGSATNNTEWLLAGDVTCRCQRICPRSPGQLRGRYPDESPKAPSASGTSRTTGPRAGCRWVFTWYSYLSRGIPGEACFGGAVPGSGSHPATWSSPHSVITCRNSHRGGRSSAGHPDFFPQLISLCLAAIV